MKGGMSVEWLARAPFSDFLIPGFTLPAANAIGQIAGAVMPISGHHQAGAPIQS